MRRCIYCLEKKPYDEFNREHVIPEAFGKFEQNLVLTCVCRDCNDLFGKTLDRKLARDSIEGLDRYRTGLKAADSYKGYGKGSTSRVEIMEGPYKGALCKYRPAVNGEDFDIDALLPQIGFSQTEDGPFEYFLLDAVPTKDELVARGYTSQACTRICGMTVEEGIKCLQSKGFPQFEHRGEVPPPTGRGRVDYVFNISHPEFRSVCKIAMNYLAAVVSPNIACMPQFNEVRRYVFADFRPNEPVVEILKSVRLDNLQTRQPVRSHLLTVESHDGEIVAQVSFFNRLRYLVHLSRGAFALPVAGQCGHMFDLDDRVVRPLSVLPPHDRRPT